MAKTYDTYKDSGIAWIGEIPGEWRVDILSLHLYDHCLYNDHLKENNLLSLSYGRIIRKDINTKEGLLPSSFNRYNIIDKGDIVLRLTDLQNDKKSLRTGLCKERGIITSAYLTLRNRGYDDSSFLHYLLHTYDLCKVFYGMGNGVRQGMNYSDVRKFKIPCPPLFVQQSISSFLDTKCGEIDSLISLQEEMISELQAYKQSVITEAVTKGLDKNVKMKDSGVEWIGEIPEHWKLPQLRFVTSKIGSGSTPTGGANVYVNEGVKFLRSQNVYNEGFKLDDVAYITPETHNQMSGTKVLEGDILFNITGGSIGRCCLVDANLGEANVNQHVSIVRPSSIYGKYLMYYLQSEAGQMQVNILQTGGNREGLSASAFSEFHICVPSPNEQHSIATYLDKKTSLIDSLIAIKQEKITELKDYKKSIIYEYVTGKKEVV